MQKSKLLLPRSPPGHGKGPPQLSWISALREEELSGVDSWGDWSCGWHSMPTLGSRLDANSKTEPGSADGVGRRGDTATKRGAQTRWQMRVRLVISMDGLAWYLIFTWVLLTSLTCQRKCKQNWGRGRKKDTFLTEKARDRESFRLFRHGMAHNKHHTERKCLVGPAIFQSLRAIFSNYGRRGRVCLEVPTI